MPTRFLQLKAFVNRLNTLSKKYIAVVLYVTVALMCTANAQATDLVDKGFCGADENGQALSWQLNTEGILTISGEGAMVDYSLDSEAPWSAYQEDIKAVIINHGLSRVGNRAFFGCKNMTNIVIPISVTSIGERAFSNSGLAEVTIPDSVTEMGDSVFSYCTNLKKVVVGSSVKNIPRDGFSSCENLVDLTLSDGLLSISGNAFFNCNALKTVMLPQSLSQISGNSFEDCRQLTSFSIESANAYYTTIDGVLYSKNIDTLVLYPFGKATAIYEIPDGVTTIAANAFSGCQKISHVTVPDSVQSINYRAFYGSKLKSISVGKNVSYIESQAFQYCYCLVTVTNHSSMAIEKGSDANGYIAAYALDVNTDNVVWTDENGFQWYVHEGHCYLLGYIGTNQKIIFPQEANINGELYSQYDIYQYAFQSSFLISEIVVPGNVKTIGKYAFDNSRVKSVILLDGVSSIEDAAFSWNSIDFISIPCTVSKVASTAFQVTNLIELHFCGTEKQLGKLMQPSDVGATYYGTITYGHNFDKWVCTYCGYFSDQGGVCGDNLTWYVDDNGILTISGTGDMYNYECKANWGNTAPWFEQYGSKIRTVIIENGVTSIGNAAFANCYNINSISIPETVASIGSQSFSRINSGNLKEIIIPAAVTHIGQDAFAQCSQLEKIFVAPDNGVYASDQSGVLYSKDYTTLIFCPAGATFESYKIDSRTTAISKRAFFDSQKCGSVTLPDGLLSIGEEAFSSADGLTGIYIPASVIEIGDRAFSGCVSLERFVVAPQNKYYTADANGVLLSKDGTQLLCFPSGRKVASYTVADEVNLIAPGAFINACITNVTLPEGLTSIGCYAFEYCLDLKNICLPSTLRFIGHDAFYNCLRLDAVLVPSSVECIEYRAFRCFSEGAIVFEGNAPSIGSNCFDDNATLYYRDGTTGWTSMAAENANIKCISATTGAVLHATLQSSQEVVTGVSITIIPLSDIIPLTSDILLMFASYTTEGKMITISQTGLTIAIGEIQKIFFKLSPDLMLRCQRASAFALSSSSFTPVTDTNTISFALRGR